MTGDAVTEGGGKPAGVVPKRMSRATSPVTCVAGSDGLSSLEEEAEAVELWPKISASTAAMRSTNGIRQLIERMRIGKQGEGGANREKQVVDEALKPVTRISLAIGDPTTYGNLPVNEIVTEAIVDAVRSGKANGYFPSSGLEAGRQAVAENFSEPEKGVHLTSGDVILTSGCSHAILMSVSALVDPSKGQNILIPQPGFALYRTICDYVGAEIRGYPLLPEDNWNISLEAVERLMDSKTAAILINNPSNPCGSVYSPEHLAKLLQLCERHHVPVIADEIYRGITFHGTESVSLASVSRRRVPILSICGLSKRYMVPGWRLGWIMIHDVDNALNEVRRGLERLATLIIGPNSIVQSALPRILEGVENEYIAGIGQALETNADYIYDRTDKIAGLKPSRPDAAMFMMIDVRDIMEDDVEFMQLLNERQNLMVLPGSVFGAPGYVRVTFSAPISVLSEACDRLSAFCSEVKASQEKEEPFDVVTKVSS